MDMMQLRRNMMGVIAGMASGSVLDNLLEVVSFVTPSQDVQEIEFPYSELKYGSHLIVSDPPGNISRRDQISYAQYLNALFFDVRGVDGNLRLGATIAIEIRKVPTASENTDWWTSKITITNNGLTVSPTQGRYGFLAGYTYYLLRIKGS